MQLASSVQPQEQTCPQCQALIPVYEGYPTWCDQCGWNLQAPEPSPFLTLFDKLHLNAGQKAGRHLFAQMVNADPAKPRFSLSKLLAYLLALPVYGITLLFIGLGLWIIWAAWPNWWGFLLAVPFFLIAWSLLPRLPKPEGKPLSRERFPYLYQLTDRIAGALGSSPVEGIIPDVNFNASMVQAGWRRQKVMTLGLPLLAILSGPEKVAIIGHEIAHGVNGDSTRGLFMGTAIYALATWYRIIHPWNRWELGVGPVAILLFLVNIVSLAVAGVIWLWAYALHYLLWRDSQRAEYLADWLAARVAGTEAHLAALEKLHLAEVFSLSLKATYLNREGQNFFAKFRERVARVPARELERIKRVRLMSEVRLDASHPPTAYRIEFLKAHPVPEAAVVVSAEEWAQVEQELLPLYEELQDRLFELDSHTFRAMFRLNW